MGREWKEREREGDRKRENERISWELKQRKAEPKNEAREKGEM